MVKDSIIDIKAECVKMINASAGLTEGVELSQCVKLVEETLTSVEQEYAKSERYDDVKITALKNVCESSAIRLEKCLALSIEEYKNRYQLRCLISEVHDRVRHAMQQFQMDKNSNKLEQVIAERAFVERCIRESKHILLCLDNQDIVCLWDLYNRY